MCSTYVLCPGAAKTSFCCSAATAFGTSCRPRPLWTSCGTSWATAAAGPGALRAENSKPRRSCRRCHWVTGENWWKLQFFKEPKRWKKNWEECEKNVRCGEKAAGSRGNIWQHMATMWWEICRHDGKTLPEKMRWNVGKCGENKLEGHGKSWKWARKS